MTNMYFALTLVCIALAYVLGRLRSTQQAVNYSFRQGFSTGVEKTTQEVLRILEAEQNKRQSKGDNKDV